jgi:hypothetical protein
MQHHFVERVITNLVEIPIKKLIREMRDFWYELCEERSSIGSEMQSLVKEGLKDFEHGSLQIVKEILSSEISSTQTIHHDQLVKAFFNAKVESEFFGQQYTHWLRKLDPEDARWVFLAAKHSIHLLETVKFIRDNNIELIEGDDKEISCLVELIDIEKLEEIFFEFSEICKIPDDLVAGIRDVLIFLKEN